MYLYFTIVSLEFSVAFLNRVAAEVRNEDVALPAKSKGTLISSFTSKTSNNYL